MKKYALISLALLSFSISSLSLEAMKEGDELKNVTKNFVVPVPQQTGNVDMEATAHIAQFMTKDLETTDQYYGLPRVPLIHPYNFDNSPGAYKVLLALQGKMPRGLFLEDPKIASAMDSVGVKSTDPFLIIVQPHFSDTESNGVPLLRPMYYFSQNKNLKQEGYNEGISLKAAIVGSNDLSITPDTPTSQNQFGVSVHTGGDNLQISSGANMAVPGLQYNDNKAFFGFYKNTGRTVSGAVKEDISSDNAGVSVLHVLLSENSRDVLSPLLNGKKTVEDVLQVLKSFKTHEQLALTGSVLKGMLEEEDKEPWQFATYGWKNGLNYLPNDFNPELYRKIHPGLDSDEGGIGSPTFNPLGIKDPNEYAKWQFATYGWKNGLNYLPNDFNPELYRKIHPGLDSDEGGIGNPTFNPLGIKDRNEYAKWQFATYGWNHGLNYLPNDFNPDLYRKIHPGLDSDEGGIGNPTFNPLGIKDRNEYAKWQFATYGWNHGLNYLPNDFNPDLYRKIHPGLDSDEGGIGNPTFNPLGIKDRNEYAKWQFATYGWNHGLNYLPNKKHE
ncbi:hypothetical protein Bealeia1_01806 [Candidatus Bealeia paramacronuclearis]|uniref:Uncharacterized protein n=1 Tax=Candidatus Bealeia paramacronuclearis TaxID=1921001 RepID=A0ABZ2C8R3_9PROT|nr:hypothetical protein [Candidatus Bealeia paramacronuclearis]